MKTYASSKVLMASLIPSAPEASVPYGNLLEPDIFLSSDTRSDSSLPNQTHVSTKKIGRTDEGKKVKTYRKSENTLDILPTAKILFRMTFLLSAESSAIFATVDTSDVVSSSELSSSSSFVHVFRTATNMSVTVGLR